MAVANHPRLELSGDEPTVSLVLTDLAGDPLMESADTFATVELAQAKVREIEDALLEAFPQPAPFRPPAEE